jgi:aminoglycoside phosphotransferase (APT) family kinase protein
VSAGIFPGLDLPTLASYLPNVGVDVVGELHATPLSGGKSNLTYCIRDDRSTWVLRRPPTAGLTPSAHDVGREYRVTAALQGTDVPVARTVTLCDDESIMGAPFSLVDFVEGRIVRTAADLEILSATDVDGCVHALVDVLAGLHAIDFRAAGLGDFGRPAGYLNRQVALWAKQWDRVKTRESDDVYRLRAALSDAIPRQSEVAIVHGDYRIDNTILANEDVTSVVAVVDWELSTLGDPLADVALMCVYRHPAFNLVIGDAAAWTDSRLPSAADIAEMYARRSARDLANWGFYLALANYKLAVIAEGILHRHISGATSGSGFDRIGEAVPEFLAAGLRTI